MELGGYPLESTRAACSCMLAAVYVRMPTGGKNDGSVISCMLLAQSERHPVSGSPVGHTARDSGRVDRGEELCARLRPRLRTRLAPTSHTKSTATPQHRRSRSMVGVLLNTWHAA